jgi:hypothetical protein
MPLDFQQLDIVFDEGIDTKTNAKMALKPSVLENAIFKEAKAINTRRGHTALGTSLLGGGTLTAASSRVLAAIKNEILQVNANTLYGYSSTLAKWVKRSNTNALPAVSIARTPVAQTSQSMTFPDACTVGNLTLVAWQLTTDTTVHVLVFDNVTGTILLQDTAVSASARLSPRCVALGTNLYVIYAQSGGANLYERHVTTAAPQTLTAEASIAANSGVAGTGNGFDVCAWTASKAVIAYNSSTAATTNVAIFDSATSTITSSTNFAKASAISASVVFNSTTSTFLIAYLTGTEVGIIELTTALAVSSATVVLSAAADPSQGAVVCVGIGATAGKAVVFYNDGTLGTASRSGIAGTYAAATTFKYFGAVAAKPFVHNSERLVVPYALSNAGTAFSNSTYLLIDYERGDLIAQVLPQRGTYIDENSSKCVPSSLALSASQFYIPLLETISVDAAAGQLRGVTGVSGITVTFDAGTTKAALGPNAFLAQGRLLEFDGISAFENGFYAQPKVSLSASGAGGSMATGSYQFVAVLVWIDANGQRHRSAPSPIGTVAVTGPTGKVTVTVGTNLLTEKRSGAFAGRQNAYFEIYSTEANGSVFYRTTPLTGQTFNPNASRTITYDRTVADASITGNDLLYTTGGVLEHIAPPATNCVIAHRNRLFLISSEFPTQIWYSGQFTPGEGVWFNDLMVIDVGDSGGDALSLGSLDDKLVIFKRNNILVVSGDGPDDTGSNNTFSLPYNVPSDVGCANPNSVVTTPEGVIFQSASGLCILNRGLQVEYIGAAVEAYNAQTITAALLVADQDQARFFTSGGTCLVYDYLFQQWSTFTNISAVDAVMSNAVLNFLLSSGEVRREAAATYTDNGTDYYMRVRTPWIHGTQQGIARVKRVAILGDYKSAHTISLKVYRDYDDTLVDTYTKSTATFYGGTGPEQIEFDLVNQKGQAFSFEIQATGAAAGQALSLSALSLTVGIKKGLAKLPATKVY